MSLRSENSDDAAQRMLAAVPGAPALGRGPVSDGGFSRHDYHHPAAGWGAAESVGHVLERAGEPIDGFRALFVMNHEDGGFDCPGCAWPDDPTGLHLDLCENWVKHVTWELTRMQVGREFFAAHAVSELAGWSDYDLEAEGRLSEPMSYDAASDRYVPISWEEAFELVGSALRGLESPHQASFYASGRLSNEARFLYQLWVREFGTNNLPDCSNMCHEASGRALMASIGTGMGTVDLGDWERADAILLMGDNAATNAPDRQRQLRLRRDRSGGRHPFGPHRTAGRGPRRPERGAGPPRPGADRLVTDPNALSIPPHITGQQVKGFALAGGKIVLDGGVGKMIELARANVRNIPHPTISR
jgi:hypothetical protein